MVHINTNMLVRVLSGYKGVDLVSLGKPRDAFALPRAVPHWTSGYGGEYEMVHTHVPVGTMIAAGDLEKLTLDDFEALKHTLSNIDIYPTGHSGDFTNKKTEELKAWFFERSVLNDEVNDQLPLRHTAHQVTQKKLDERFGAGHYETLVNFLADEMHIFRDPKQGGALVPSGREDRVEITKAILDGLAHAVRYTRIDGAATGYQFKNTLDVASEGAGTISFRLEEKDKMILLRKDPKTGEATVSPLNREMIGKTYDTKDGEPLGDRGSVDIMEIMERANELSKKDTSIKGIIDGGPKNNRGSRHKV